MKRRMPVVMAALAVLAIALCSIYHNRPVPRADGALPQEFYIWQRSWGDALHQALETSDLKPAGYVVFGGEVAWKQGDIRVARAQVDYKALKATGLPVGLALRIGPYSGPFEKKGQLAATLVELATSLVKEARQGGIAPTELQLDFDCAESKLDGYRVWVELIAEKVGDVPVIITALPCWLRHRTFRRLVAETDGYILQVHSLVRPASADSPMCLCDPVKSRQWIEQAARIGVPFRVALPTYGYVVAFARTGEFVGLSAEGPALSWPADAQLRSLRADPAAMARLVQDLTRNRPESMQGVIWYRMPTSDDRLNWSAATLRAVMEGREPRAELTARVRRTKEGLAELDLVNSGDDGASLDVTVSAKWQGARLVAADSIGGFRVADVSCGEVRMQAGRLTRLEQIPPGGQRQVGWLRLSENTEVEADAAPAHP